MNANLIQWLLLSLSGLAFIFIAPKSKTVGAFFAAKSEEKKDLNLLLLISSLVISWIFAKSIANAANLGMKFGIIGGFAYAIYYFSFLIAGLLIYKLRVKGKFNSIHEFLRTKFGAGAVILFSVLIGIRLFNEIWSNTMLIGGYFGEAGSWNYYIAILLFTALTLAYVLKGGLQSSLLTDLIQMAFFAILLVVLLVAILPSGQQNLSHYVQSSEWRWDMGLNLVFVAFLQIFSYPFHDSVLTDRAFIASPKTTRKAFFWASIVGFLCILLFSFIGIFARFQNLEGDASVSVAQMLGTGTMLMMNFIMVSSAASTLDSAFASFSKLMVLDIGKPEDASIKKGRLMMIFIAVAGTIPIFFSPEILSATTVSGTMVIGLAPVFIFWNTPAPKASFYLPIVTGLILGIILALGFYPQNWHFTRGDYADLLSANILGSIACFAFYFLPILFVKIARKS